MMIDPEQEKFRLDFSPDAEEPPLGIEIDFHPGSYDALIKSATPLLVQTRKDFVRGLRSASALEAVTDIYLRSINAELHRMFMDAGDALMSSDCDTLVSWQANFCEQVGQSVAYWEAERMEQALEKPGRVQRVFGWLFSARETTDLKATEGAKQTFLQSWRQFTAEHILKMNGEIDAEVVLGEAYQTVIRQLNQENQQENLKIT